VKNFIESIKFKRAINKKRKIIYLLCFFYFLFYAYVLGFVKYCKFFKKNMFLFVIYHFQNNYFLVKFIIFILLPQLLRKHAVN